MARIFAFVDLQVCCDHFGAEQSNVQIISNEKEKFENRLAALAATTGSTDGTTADCKEGACTEVSVFFNVKESNHG